MMDSNTTTIDPESMRIWSAHGQGGFSVRYLEQFIQNYLSNRFQQFDYGLSRNLETYGSEIPPLYDISAIQDIPIVLLSARYDEVCVPEDIDRVASEVSNSLVTHNSYEFGHMGFYIGRDMSFLDDIADILSTYSN